MLFFWEGEGEWEWLCIIGFSGFYFRWKVSPWFQYIFKRSIVTGNLFIFFRFWFFFFVLQMMLLYVKYVIVSSDKRIQWFEFNEILSLINLKFHDDTWRRTVRESPLLNDSNMIFIFSKQQHFPSPESMRPYHHFYSFLILSLKSNTHTHTQTLI